MSGTQLSQVYSIANALMCSKLSHTARPIVLRTRNAGKALDLVRKVAGAAGLDVVEERNLRRRQTYVGPVLVLVTGDGCDADCVAAAAAWDEDVHVAIMVDEGRRKERLASIGEAMIAQGLIERDDDLETHQQVPSSEI
jgi:hypothetical protein